MRTSACVWTEAAKAPLLTLAISVAALGQEAAVTSGRYLEEITVTAKEWEQSANNVGMPNAVARFVGLPATYDVSLSARL